MSTRHKSEKVQGTHTNIKKESSLNPSHIPLASQNSLSNDLTDLVVYCKAKPGGVNMKRIKESLRYAHLKKKDQPGLKEMNGKPVNRLDYSDNTSINNENLAKMLIEAKK